MTAMDWAAQTHAALTERITPATVAVLPLGAIEQHGPHLPLATDTVIAEALVEAALARLGPDVDGLRLPTLALGDSREHQGQAGTLSLSPTTFQAVLADLGAAVARAGCRRLLLFSGHGGNLAAMDTVALDLRMQWAMLVVKACYFDFPPPPDTLPVREWQEGLHGGALETALMQHLAPAWVDGSAIGHHPSVEFDALAEFDWLGAASRPACFAWAARDLNPAGVCGDARLASAALGEKLLAHYAGQLAAVIEETARFPLDCLRD